MKLTLEFETEGRKVTTIVEDILTIPEALEAYESFLKGAGFAFTGSLQIVEEESEYS